MGFQGPYLESSLLVSGLCNIATAQPFGASGRTNLARGQTASGWLPQQQGLTTIFFGEGYINWVGRLLELSWPFVEPPTSL